MQHMNFPTSLRSFLLAQGRLLHPAYRYGFLALLAVLLLFSVSWRLRLPPSYPYDRNGDLVVSLLLIINHLAFQFRWRPSVTIVLRLLAIGCIVFAFWYFWSLGFGRR